MAARSEQLDPWPKRLAVFAVLAAVAVGSIWLLDQRAMQRQAEMRRAYEQKVECGDASRTQPATKIPR